MRQTIILAALALAACAANNVRWVRAGATEAEFNADKARCEYEANLATPGSFTGRGTANAIADGINDGMRIGNLQVLCMQAKGWQRQVMTASAAPNMPTDKDGVPEPLPMNR